jgi:hypothetical protein
MPDQKNAAHKPNTKTATQRTALVLGGTGRTGALVARQLSERGLDVRTASRHGANVAFDWDDPGTYARPLLMEKSNAKQEVP